MQQPHVRISDLDPKQAQKLIRDAVSSGVFRAVVALAVVWVLVVLLWWCLARML